MTNKFSCFLTQKGRWLTATLFLLFSLGIGQMWGADPTHTSPAIVKVANRHFLDLTSTPSNVTVSTDSYSNYGPGYFISNKNADLSSSWWAFTGTFKSTSNGYSNHKDAVGFHAVGSSSSSEFYQILQMRTGSGRMTQMDFYVTGTTQMGVQWKNGGSNSEKYLTFTVYEMNVSGTTATDVVTPVSTIEGSITTTNQQYATSAALSGSKYYHIVVTAAGESNCDIYGLTFKHAPAASYTITYNANGGSGTMSNSTNTVSECTFTAPNATTQEFKEWRTNYDGTGTKYEAGDVATSDLNLFAIWQNKVVKYDVTFNSNGGSAVAAQKVVEGQTATEPTAPTRDCYTFAGWYNGENAFNFSTAITDDVELTAHWTPKYASTLDFAAVTTAGTTGSNPIGTFLASGNMVASNLGSNSGWETSTAKSGFVGYKLKNTSAVVKFLVKAGKEVEITLGSVGAAAKLNKGGVESEIAKKSGDNEQTVIPAFVAESDILVTITTNASSDATVTLKKIAINQLYTATYSTAKSTVTPTSASNVTEVTLPTPAATTVGDYTFAGWKADKVVKDGDGDDQAIGTTLDAGETYTLTANTIFTAQWTETSSIFDITEGTHTNGNITISPASQQEAGETVTLTATPDEDYVFSAWDVFKTGESTTKVNVTNNAFTMPSYDVTVNATFVDDTRAKVLYVTSNSADDTKASDKLYAALKDTYNVKIVGSTSDANQSAYALVVLHESVGGSDYGATAVAAAKTGNTPVLNTKSYFYNDGRWAWGTPNAGKTIKGATLNSAYCNIASHPLFNGVTMTSGFFEITDEAAAKCMQPVGSFASGKEGYTLATTPNEGDGNGCAIHELTPAQRGASGKYLMISVSNAKLNALNANGQKLFQNAAAYLIGNTAWEPEGPKTVTHTLTGVTTSSDDEVCAGVAYEATYVAESGYSLPASVTVKAGSTDITSNCTWTQATGVLAIPALQVTDNIEIIVNGVFNCPAAGSGDVLFSWTPKSGSVSTEYIAAGGVDLAPYMESVVGGSITGYAQAIDETTTTLYKNSNNHVYFNGNSAYIKVDLCELAEGDKILVSGQDKNMWVSTSATRPANAEAAAAVLVPGEAFYVPNASALIGLSTIYIFREASFTEVASLTITRSKKFTVTYEASDLTEGAAPAAVDAFDGQKIIVAGQGTMVKGADHFAGWKDAGDNEYAENDELTVTADMTLTAQWTACAPLTLAMSGYETTLTAGGATTTVTLDKGASTGTVTWESSDATILSVEDGVITPLKGGTATVTAHVAEDATYCANDITSDEITVNCVVTYNANGGEGTMADATGTTVTIAANGFTYDSHKFLRWNTQPDGLGDNVAVGATVNENKTLYAIWKEVTCTAGANIFSIEFTNTANVNMADGDDDKDMSSYATIVGGSALMSYFKSGSNANVLTYGSSTSKASFGTNAQYLQLNLDCALQKGDVITIANESGNKTAIASGLAADKYPLNGTKESTSSTNSYTVLENDNIENADVLYIGRNTSSGSLTFTAITIYRPLPDAPVPTINNATPADAEYTGAASPMMVVAEVEGAEDLHYQWYKEAGETDIEVGTDAASYTPTASGEYYCVVTNSPTGYTPKSATSRTATITMISSDATLAWLKADGNDIALSDGVYAYEYTLPYNYAAEGAPTITYATTDANATITNFTPAATKTGTATINVLAQDGVTSHEYAVKFNEYSGCMDEFYFAEVDDADANSVEQNEHGLFSNMVGDGTGVSATFEVDGTEYTVTRGTSSSSSFGKLTIPAGFNANVYVALKTSGSNRTVTLVPTSGPSYTSANLASSGNHVAEFEDVAAGTYTINVSSGSNFVMVKAHMCKYAVTGVSLPTTEEVLKNRTITLTPVFTPAEASVKTVTWASDNEAVATVANGVVTGVAVGTANITVTTIDGGFQAICAVTVTEMDCDAFIGNLFSFAVVATEDITYTNVGEGENEKVIGAEVATVSNGAAYVGHTGTKADVAVAAKQSSVEYFKLADANTYLRIVLPSCALKAGDMISLTSLSQSFYISTTATYPSNAADRIEIAANGKYMVQYGDILEGVDEIYVWRKSGSTYLKTLSIDRGTSIRNLTPGRMGTFTTAYDVNYFAGADFYVPNQIYSIGIEFIEVKELKAGYSYLLVANGDKLFVVNEGDAVIEAETNHGADGTRGMIGYLGTDPVRVDVPDGDDYAVVKNNHLYTAYNNTMTAGYAYFDMTIIRDLTPMNNSNGAPRRRMTVGYEAPAVTTDINNLEAGETPVKLMINGQIFILRGEKLYDATGRLVK